MSNGHTIACFCAIILTLCFFKLESLSAFQRKVGRLSIDYGPRTIGVAHGNHLGVVKPYGTIQNKGKLSTIASQIVDLARTWSVSEIILGVPLDSNGKLHYKVMLFDERYTTKEATLRLQSEKIKASLDAMSAACLLERYVEDCGEGSLPALACYYPIPSELDDFDYNSVRLHVRSLYTARRDRNKIRKVNGTANGNVNRNETEDINVKGTRRNNRD